MKAHRRAALAALVLAACTGADPLGLGDTIQLAAAEHRWADRGFGDYRFEMRTFCFCGPERQEWAEVQVTAGAITSVRFVDSAQALPPSRFPEWATVEQLFQAIRDAGRVDYVADVRARFDPGLGYPTRITLTADPAYPDGGVRHELRSAGPIPHSLPAPLD